ncbi:anhydro-N-acetylmuramic acid kinase AnmK [Ignatzschineria rhizosphaerae]|uniref:Anhydro-N-acetylmuramic acid kinase n=1 Tax=Ignatzschineria rhizosphaerae TaxID=2923279 RepID=A0ABY3WXS7_9GAMM|nr:anhydro-N-acetylmuramic acid kinase AnmK [Ignatzschineria rhizosphaerae]UNM95414.1 anhydro-N-acetylmuramic acid kinase AnmK [Ignatzschineria rhizosphaerae]
MSKAVFAVGLMTGTSLDGIDAALVKLKGQGLDTECELLHFLSKPLSLTLRQKISKECDNMQSTVAGICSLNMELGVLYSETVTALLAEALLAQQTFPEKFAGFKGKLDFIASHGQTIYHLPQKVAKKAGLMPSTLQIGDPSLMAYQHQTDVYFNFRMMDVAAGGDGAPLVPLTELILYSHPQKNRLLQNIGGIGNVTVMPQKATIEDIWAFDTGPGNMMINDAMMYLYQKPFDDKGAIAKSGALIEDLYSQLIAHPYLLEKPPKSTGRELFGSRFTDQLLQSFSYEKPEDLIHTLTRFTAYTIAENYRQFILPYHLIDEVIIGGGGAYNLALVSYLQEELPNISVLTNEEIGISSDAKEAIAFALLGYQTRMRQIGNVPKATGAIEALVIGQLCPNPFPIILE